MTKLLVLYYSMYGHIEIMAGAIAEGARSVESVEVTVKRVPELMSEEIARKHGANTRRSSRSTAELRWFYSARRRVLKHGRANAELLIRPAGWTKGAHYKAKERLCEHRHRRWQRIHHPHIHSHLLHHGMIFVGLPYVCPELDT
jgi:NAD(P)H dehydrogenase (quinone)